MEEESSKIETFDIPGLGLIPIGSNRIVYQAIKTPIKYTSQFEDTFNNHVKTINLELQKLHSDGKKIISHSDNIVIKDISYIVTTILYEESFF